MDAAQILVSVVGLSLIVAVNLYFFARRRGVTAVEAGGVQEVHVAVRGGYEPAVIQVRAGRPVRLVFRREETEGCSDTVLLPEWGIAQSLPAGVETAVEFMPAETGTFEFTCGMHMLRGRVVVNP